MLLVVGPMPISLASPEQRLIEQREVVHLRPRHQQVTAQIADLVLHVPLFVATVRVAQRDREPIVRLKALEQIREADRPRHFPAHGRGVVEDQPRRHPPEALEHRLQPREQTLRRLPPKQLQVARMAEGEAHGKILASLWGPVQYRFGRAEVHLTLAWMPDQFQSARGGRGRPQTLHVALDQGVRPREVGVLSLQALPDALGRVVLLVEGAGIVGQPLLNHGSIGIEFRGARRPRRRRRGREILLRQILADGLAVDAEAGRNRAGTEALVLQRFDLGLLGHGDHSLLQILLCSATRRPWLHLTAGSPYSQTRDESGEFLMLKVGKSR